MSEAKHTPGPWLVRPAHGSGMYHHITSVTNDNIAAFARLEDARHVVDLMNRDGLAREMADFLKEVCEQSDAKIPTIGTREREAESLYRRALALIAKATGA